MDHSAGDLVVVMEAVGLSDIHHIPMDDVVTARQALCKRQPSRGVFRSTPFILVGRKGS